MKFDQNWQLHWTNSQNKLVGDNVDIDIFNETSTDAFYGPNRSIRKQKAISQQFIFYSSFPK